MEEQCCRVGVEGVVDEVVRGGGGEGGHTNGKKTCEYPVMTNFSTLAGVQSIKLPSLLSNSLTLAGGQMARKLVLRSQSQPLASAAPPWRGALQLGRPEVWRGVKMG